MKNKPYSPVLIVIGLILIGTMVILAVLMQPPAVYASGTPVVITGVQASLSDMQTAQAKMTAPSGGRVAPDPLHRPTITPKAVLAPNATPDPVLNVAWIQFFIRLLLLFFRTG